MSTLSIDIETYSSYDLKTVGVYKYVQAPDFKILLLSYAFDNDEPEVVDLANFETIPGLVEIALFDDSCIKTAFNANFERTCLARHFGAALPPDQWRCTMVKAGVAGLPMSLDQAAKVLGVDQQKDESGKGLIKYFSIPCKPSKKNNERTRNYPEHNPTDWAKFKEYCNQDVRTERAVSKAVDKFIDQNAHSRNFYNRAFEQLAWALDQKINDNGILVDKIFVKNAIKISEANTEKLTAAARELTGLDNPNSAAQIKNWLAEEEPFVAVTSLTKDSVKSLMDEDISEKSAEVLTLRLEMAKTSVKKYMTVAGALCADSHIRGILQFYGANRTGRYSGRLLQPQNLPQNHLADLDLAREVVKSGDMDLLQLLFGNVPDTLSQLIRTALIAPDGDEFIIADYSAIEARIIAWLAGERWRMEVFNTHGKIYEASAAQMFKVPIESVTKGSDLRQRGKVSELALGYQGGPNALISMGALKMGVAEDELPRLVKMWRNANKAIVALWDTVNNAAIDAVATGEKQTIAHGISFSKRAGAMIIALPSGRELVYQTVSLRPGKFGNEAIVYWGMDQTTKKWCRQDTYGGKLVENIVQAIARDILQYAMLNLDKAGIKIVLHVHDEIVNQVAKGTVTCEDINKIMCEPIPWAKGLPLRADSFTTTFYKKD